MSSVFDFAATRLDGSAGDLAQYRGKVLLIVNTASQCGFTPQYAGLQQLHQQYGARGFAVLGFPCNQFGRQEPADHTEIGAFCEKNYGVDFPMFAKVDVNGAHALPLFVYLKDQARGILRTRAIKWNFTKFLVDKNGKVLRRYGSRTPPQALMRDIEALLGQ